jgi:hypothetical protein
MTSRHLQHRYRYILCLNLAAQYDEMVLSDFNDLFRLLNTSLSELGTSYSVIQIKGTLQSSSENDKSLARDDAFSIWSDAPPQLSIGQSSRSTSKGWTLPDVYDLYRPASHIKLTCKYLGFQTIRFKFHDQIKQRSISFQSAIPKTTQGNKRLCVSRWYVKFYPTSNKRPRSTQGAYFRSQTRSANQCVQISQELLINVPNHHTFYTRSTVYKK